MNGLISTVSGYFSKALILGSLLPTVVFLAFFIIVINPYLPSNLDSIEAIRLLGTEWKLVSVSFIAIVLSGLLHNLSSPHVRVYEGYPWKNTWFGKWMTSRKKQKFRTLSAEQLGLRALLKFMKRTKNDHPENIPAIVDLVGQHLVTVPKKARTNIETSKLMPKDNFESWYSMILGRWGTMHRRVLNEFPANEQLILPTRCGNVIRSFEHYPEREYGMDAIALFPRLVSQMDKEHRELIDDAKTSFDFMINSATLAVVLGISLILIGITTGSPFRSSVSTFSWLIQIVVIFAVAYVSYQGAINRAYTWGDTVKGGFDLYRSKLLKQLGYSQTPDTKAEERTLWRQISLQMLDGDFAKGRPRIDYQDARQPSTFTTGGGNLHVSRGLSPTDRENVYRVTITCLNSGETAAENVLLHDTIPAGWNYKMKSAQLLDGDGRVVDESVSTKGIDAVQFSIGDLAADCSAFLQYEILSLNSKSEEAR